MGRTDKNKVFLIDMGLATKYTKLPVFKKPDTTNEHIEEAFYSQRGNIGFASPNSSFDFRVFALWLRV